MILEFSFLTIQSPVEDILLKEKGSKFIGFCFPVSGDEDIKLILKKVREQHPKATHHCYAYRTGINGENFRANDDGEPNGSAGLPIYNQILSQNITNILVIVVRYYGGTKLGVSGLVKAYKESAKTTIESTEIITKELETDIEINFKFSQQNQIFTLLHKFDGKILDFLANEDCKVSARIKFSQKKSISETLSEMQYISFNFLD